MVVVSDHNVTDCEYVICMQADDRLSLLMLAVEHLSDKLTNAEPVITDSVIVRAQIDDNQVSFSLCLLICLQ